MPIRPIPYYPRMIDVVRCGLINIRLQKLYLEADDLLSQDTTTNPTSIRILNKEIRNLEEAAMPVGQVTGFSSDITEFDEIIIDFDLLMSKHNPDTLLESASYLVKSITERRPCRVLMDYRLINEHTAISCGIHFLSRNDCQRIIDSRMTQTDINNFATYLSPPIDEGISPKIIEDFYSRFYTA